jgi:hypothetical protein
MAVAKTIDTTPERSASAPLAAMLAWFLPGLGHWFLGERRRGVIFFIVITVTFWAGIAVGGVRTTITPKENGAWIAAQLCAGPQALLALYWSNYRTEHYPQELKAGYPGSNISVVYAGVAGLLNLLIIIDTLARAEARQGVAPLRAPPKKGGG